MEAWMAIHMLRLHGGSGDNMSSNSAVLDRPAPAIYERASPRGSAPRRPHVDRAEAPRIPVTYRIGAQTKIWIDLLAGAQGAEKTEVVERAVEAYFAEHRRAVDDYVTALQRAVRGGDSRDLARLLPSETDK
jgi:hypothetical protein